MRARGIFFILTAVLLAAPLLGGDSAMAQLSPGGVFGAVTRPFREMMGILGHHRRHHVRRDRTDRHAASAPQDARADRSHFGHSGLSAWPDAFEQIVTYTFWPAEGARLVRAQGFNLIATTTTGASANRRASRVAAATPSVAAADAAGCGDAQATDDRWPSAEVGQMLELNAVQDAALERLQQAINQAVAGLNKAACPDRAATPEARLEAMVQRLWAIRDAGIYIRAPLQAFYETLSESQKAKLRAGSPNEEPRGARNAKEAMNRQYRACAAHNLQAAERLNGEIEAALRLPAEATQATAALRSISSDMAKMLSASCMQPVPADPLGRLDAANTQLASINYAAMAVREALNGLRMHLNDDQKTRLSSLGR